ncbi:MAG: ABC transporter permease [Gemmataceae bacterium]|nr:ABC transporter permease [Gemmataceae bacterium]MDW8267385.1 ABC transporter permease [Gemmataceae bacterium]
MVSYLAAIWQCRYFWLSLVQMDLRTRYRRSVLGVGWSLLQPAAMTVILCAVFYHLLKIDLYYFAPYLIAGLACWNYILTVTLHGCQCFHRAETYIRQYPAPLAIYPLRTALGATFHFLIALGLAIAVALAVGVAAKFRASADNRPAAAAQESAVLEVGAAASTHARLVDHPLAALYLLPAILLLAILAWSLALLAGFANSYFQDTQHLIEVGFQLVFYATPIIWPEDRLRSTAWVLQWNPVYHLVRLVRDPILHGAAPPLGTCLIGALTVALAASAASLVLARYQNRLIFRL